MTLSYLEYDTKWISLSIYQYFQIIEIMFNNYHFIVYLCTKRYNFDNNSDIISWNYSGIFLEFLAYFWPNTSKNSSQKWNYMQNILELVWNYSGMFLEFLCYLLGGGLKNSSWKWNYMQIVWELFWYFLGIPVQFLKLLA